MQTKGLEYPLELDLVEEFCTHITKPNNPFNIIEVAFEFNYTTGRVDVIGKTRDCILIGFEAKLYRWKNALDQAYRNTSFVNYSYVLLPSYSSNPAKKQRVEFKKRGVGLCCLSSSGLQVEIEASKKEPIQPWLTESALDYIADGGKYNGVIFS